MAPLFNKELTQTDVEKRLSIPAECLKYFPGFEGAHVVDLLVEDKSGLTWTFRCTIRKQGYPKPVLSAGWLEFVRRKDLKIGDKIIFHMEQNLANGVQYKVEVQRKIKIFGEGVWADVF